MDHQSGCLVCGGEIFYSEVAADLSCYYCGVTTPANAYCGNGHYICDTCHNASANDLIERFCTRTDTVSPLSIALTLMKNPVVKMHGPEHHFLVPAALLAAFYNGKNGAKGDRARKIQEARSRAEEVKGGFCGFQGACGAAIGGGIFMSLITGATPLSDRERSLSNMMTAECLRAIAENGGARCCKRETFRALITAAEFAAKECGIVIPVEFPPPCSFTVLNRECLGVRCAFFPGRSDPGGD
jgi:hypothetical protein